MEILRGTLHHFVSAAVLIVSVSGLSACEEAVAPPLAPVQAHEGVSADSVPDRLPFFFDADVGRFMQAAHERLDGPIGTDARGDLLAPLEPGKSRWVAVHQTKAQRWFFALQGARGFEGAVFVPSSDGHVVVPVDWMKRVLKVDRADEAALHAWYVALSQRIASEGAVSGIVVFGNGNAIAVVLDLRREVDSGDLILAARQKFFKKGQYDPSVWGPRLDGASAVSNVELNRHEGVSIEDLLREDLARGHAMALAASPATP